jgi:CrcB protein
MAAALVGLFGVAGALLRFGVDSLFAQHASIRTVRSARHPPHGWGHKARLHWPWATLLVNVAGCFIIGVSHAMTMKLGLGPEWEAALATGLAGGLTTFSSWTTATVRLLTELRFGSAVLNVAVNLGLGLAAAAAGIALAS